MSNILSKIKLGAETKSHRVVVSGPEGVGKTTFLCKAPNPLVITSEDGMTGFSHVERFVPESLAELYELLDMLATGTSKFETLGIDTADWFERFLSGEICKRDGKADIEEYGYGKGYVALENELVRILQKLDVLRNRGIWIVILSHVQIRTFTDPRGDAWDRYEMKGHKRFTGILREWPDACLFAVYEVHQVKKKGEQKERTIGGERVLHTEWSPAWDAKNRLNLPEKLPLDWDEFVAAVKANSPESLAAKVKALHASAKSIDEAAKPKWQKFIDRLQTVTADKLKGAIEALEKLQ